MGCPFLKKEITDPLGKNLTRGFPIRFISKLDFVFKQQKRVKSNEHISTWIDSLPFCIKHSLFLNGDTLQKLRKNKDSPQILFLADDTKIKGNEQYEQGHYYRALDIYE